MNPVCRDQISTRPAETDFTLRLLREIEFHPGKLGQFSTWFLLKFEYFFFKFLFERMSVQENSSIQKQAPEAFSIQKANLRNIHRKHMFWSNFIKKRLQHRFSCKCCKSFKNNYFEEHLRTAASVDSKVFSCVYSFFIN